MIVVKKDIFEDIVYNLSDCYYISDLRNMLNTKGYLKIIHAIEKLHYEDYTVNQWCEIIEYILQKKISFADNKEAYKYLMQELKNTH